MAALLGTPYNVLSDRSMDIIVRITGNIKGYWLIRDTVSSNNVRFVRSFLAWNYVTTWEIKR